MVYVKTWEEFSQQAEAICQHSPDRTRFVTKYRHADGRLELRVTNNAVCAQFCTKIQALFQFAALQENLTASMHASNKFI